MTRKPCRKFLPLTYQPKIPGVLEGSITQSIRIDTQLAVGDMIAFHGWQGRPYHSPWSFRTPFMQLTMAMPISFQTRKDSVYFPESGETYRRPSGFLNNLAALDGIDPPTAEELIQIIRSMHGKGTLHGKILRWDPSNLKPARVPATIIEGSRCLLKPSTNFIQIGDIEKHYRDNPATSH